MIKSRNNTFSCWFLFIMTTVLLSFLLGNMITHYYKFETNFINTFDDKDFYIMTILLGYLNLMFMIITSSFIKKIKIDSVDKTICYKNILTRQAKTYDFADFDGFIDTYLSHNKISYKTVGLVKDKKVLRYIDSCWVSNYDELRQSLDGLKCLGTYNFNSKEQLRLLLRRPIID